MGGLDVQAEDIIDIIEGYKGKGYAISSQEELGKCLFFILDNIICYIAQVYTINYVIHCTINFYSNFV